MIRRAILIAVAALACTSCMMPVSRTRSVLFDPTWEGRDNHALREALDEWQAFFVAQGGTTGHVFDLLLRNARGEDGHFPGSGPQVVGDPDRWDRNQRYLLPKIPAATVPANRTVRIPIRGFCLDPGRPPLGVGVRKSVKDALVEGLTHPFRVVDGAVETPDGPVPLVVPGEEGIDASHLGAKDGPVILVPADGRPRRHDGPGPWQPGDDVPEGLISVRDEEGNETARFAYARETGEEVSLASMPGKGGPTLFAPELGVRHRLAEKIVKLTPAVVKEQGVGGFDYPATTVAQQALWKLSSATSGPPPEGSSTATTRAVDEAAETVVERAEQELAEEGGFEGLDFSLLDLTRKPN